MLIFFICLLISVVCHELAHMLVSLKLGVGVKAFAIGFGKPLFHKTFKGIDYRICPIPFGGYCDIKGMESKKEKDDFLAQRYSKKLAILLAGVAVNFLIACICYLINYGSIKLGIYADLIMAKALLSKDYMYAMRILVGLDPNLFLAQLSILNILCAITNILPIPALDGGHAVLVLFEKVWKENFIKYYRIITSIGFAFLVILQFVFLYWMFFM